jgi:hypothetical protein
MRKLIRRRPSPAMIIAIVALVAALAGTAVAGGGFLKKAKFTKFKKNYNNQTGIFASHKETPVNTTPSLSQMASLTVPGGNFAINAKLYINNTAPGPNHQYQCQLVAGGAAIDESKDGLGVDAGEQQATIALQGVAALGGGGAIAVNCNDNAAAGNNTDSAKFIKITAIRSKSLSNVTSP